MKTFIPHRNITLPQRQLLERASKERYRGVPIYSGRHYRSRLLDRRNPWRLLGLWLVFIVALGLILGAVAELLSPSSAEAAPDPGLVHVINHVAYVTNTEQHAALLVAIARCESRFDTLARGRAGALGLFQMVPSTWAWASARAGFSGASPFDPLASTHAAAWLISHPEEGGGPAHWRSCLPLVWGV